MTPASPTRLGPLLALFVALSFVLTVVDAPAAFATDAGTDDAFRTAFNTEAVTEIDLTADIQMDCPDGRFATFFPNRMLTINGHGHSISAAGCPGEQVMIFGGSNGLLMLNEVTITGGSYTDDVTIGGGGLQSNSTVTLVDSTVSGNSVETTGGPVHSARGGGITVGSNGATLTLIRSTVSGNTATCVGCAATEGGGINSGGSAQVVLINSTVSSNATAGTPTSSRGGGINAADVSLTYSTVVGNSAANLGANVRAIDLTSFASVVVLATGGAGNCDLTNATTTQGYNHDDDGTCGFTGPGDQSDGGDPLLGALGDNGGPTETRLPAGGSPLVDVIPAVDCRDGGAVAIVPLVDQRSISRPQGTQCDVGAVEVAVAPDPAIAFTSNRDGVNDVFVMDADGATPTNRTTNDLDDDQLPAWSPDGSKIAFASDRGGSFDIWVMDADGSNPTQVTSNVGADLHPTWSPDGSKLAFRSDRDGNFEIYAADADATEQNVKRLTNDLELDQEPAWSPDDTLIAWASRTNGSDFEIYTMDVSDLDAPSGLTNVSQDPGNDRHPSWSHDGSTIAFTSDRDGNDEIYVMDAGGSNQTRRTSNIAPDDSPTWSPDDLQLAFTSARDGDQEIYVVDAAGALEANVANLTNTPTADDLQPDWRAASAPGAPRDVSALPGDGAVTVEWSPPVVIGGSPVTGYTATASPGGATCMWAVGPLQCTVGGLTNNTSYTFTVTATNAFGTGPASVASSAATPQAKPAKTSWPGWADGDGPRRDLPDVFVTTQGQQATVSFLAATSAPDDPVVSYHVTAQPGAASAIGAAPPITVTGLEPGVAYTFVVEARTAGGASSTSGPSEEVVVSASAPQAAGGPDLADCGARAGANAAVDRGVPVPSEALGLLMLALVVRRPRGGVSSRASRRRARSRARYAASALVIGAVVTLASGALSQSTEAYLC